MIAAVRKKGSVNLKQPHKDTLNMLRLYRKNCCAILEDNKTNQGMLRKVKEYVVFGEIDEQTLQTLGGKKFLRLNSPRKGYTADINKLIKRMQHDS
ncbi:uL30 family ribosomal protein [Candidatus Woesearchaeota archaeon]|nr:uL30 family ribosomal protein [Candidatus Woesearchaeota archaeon]